MTKLKEAIETLKKEGMTFLIYNAEQTFCSDGIDPINAEITTSVKDEVDNIMSNKDYFDGYVAGFKDAMDNIFKRLREHKKVNKK